MTKIYQTVVKKKNIFDKILNLELYSLLFCCVVSLSEQFEKQIAACLCSILHQSEVFYSNASVCKQVAGGMLSSFQQKSPKLLCGLKSMHGEQKQISAHVFLFWSFSFFIFLFLTFPSSLTIFRFKIFFLKSTLISISGIF